MAAQDRKKRGLGRGINGLIRTKKAASPSKEESKEAKEVKTSPKNIQKAKKVEKPKSSGKGGKKSTPAKALVEDVQASDPVESSSGIQEVSVESIAPNPYQPRQDFDQTALTELTQSVLQEGILQPLILTTNPGDAAYPYALIAGERRLRAAKLAGLSQVPCIVREASKKQRLEWAIIENIQRADLNPLERAKAYKECMSQFSLTQENVAKQMGQARSTVANHLRLLDLEESVQEMIASGQLSFGHARTLAALLEDPPRQLRLARKAISEGLSVRKLEALVSEKPMSDAVVSKRTTPEKPAYVRDMEQRLTESVGTRVTIQPGRSKNTGRLVLEYYNLDDFDRISTALGLMPAEGE